MSSAKATSVPSRAEILAICEAVVAKFGGVIDVTMVKGAVVANQVCDVTVAMSGGLIVSTPKGETHSSADLTRYIRMTLGMSAPAPIAANDNTPVDLWAEQAKPSLPAGLLPPVIEAFARARADQIGIDPGGLAMAAIAVCASAIPDSVRLQVKRHDADWLESARIWTVVVGGPSTKKTPLLTAALAPLRAIDNGLAQDYIEKLAAFGRLDKKTQATAARPRNVRAILEDTTVEAAQEVLRDSPAGLLLHHDEFSGFFGAMEKYGNGKGASADRAFWLQTFNGGPHSVNRIARGPVFIPNLSVSLLGGIQPEPIRKIANGLADDGLLQRLLPIVLGNSAVDRDEPVTGEALSYGALVRRLHGLQPPQAASSIPYAIVVRFSDDAQLVRDELAAKHHKMVAVWEHINRKLSSHLGKYDSFFNRLALTFHCIECEGGQPEAVISGDTASRAGDFLHRYLWRHAMAFYAGVLGLADDHDAVVATAGYILAHKPVEVTARTIQRGDSTMKKCSPDEAEDVLSRLDALGWLDVVDLRGNQHAKRYAVRPLVYSMNEDRAEVEKARRREFRQTIAESSAAI